MTSPILDETYQQQAIRLDNLLSDLERMTMDLDQDTLRKQVCGLRRDVHEPFRFVVVGEVKAGKSSFINALLKEEICQVDAAPCTDTICQITYADQDGESMTQSLVKRIGRRKSMLKGIAIVDTPGTNTVVENHQELTEEFIPKSDLVFFVFSARNPYTQSAWDLLDHVHEKWRRKVVFVLQQADLTTVEELDTNVTQLGRLADDHKVPAAEIFVTSAKLEMQKRSKSGFHKVRQFIKTTVTGGHPQFQKLISVIRATSRIMEDATAVLDKQRQEMKRDQEMAERIQNCLERWKIEALDHARTLIEQYTERYDSETEKARDLFRDGLTIQTLMRLNMKNDIMKSVAPLKNWLRNLCLEFRAHVQKHNPALISQWEKQLADGLRAMESELTTHDDAHGDTPRAYWELVDHMESRRPRVLDELAKKIETMTEWEVSWDRFRVDPHQMLPGAFKGGGVSSLIGIFIMMTTGFDQLGMLLAGLGLLMSGGAIVVTKWLLIERFTDEVYHPEDYAQQTAEMLHEQADELHQYLIDRFASFMEKLERNQTKLNNLIAEHERIQSELDELKEHIETRLAQPDPWREELADENDEPEDS